MGYSHSHSPISSDFRIHWMKPLPALSSPRDAQLSPSHLLGLCTHTLLFLSWSVPRGLQGVLRISPQPYFPCPYCCTQVVLLRYQLLPCCC